MKYLASVHGMRVATLNGSELSDRRSRFAGASARRCGHLVKSLRNRDHQRLVLEDLSMGSPLDACRGCRLAWSPARERQIETRLTEMPRRRGSECRSESIPPMN